MTHQTDEIRAEYETKYDERGRIDWLTYCRISREYANKAPTIRARLITEISVCAKCGSRDKLTIDHIVSLRKGGRSTDDNLQILCLDCNRSKGAR